MAQDATELGQRHEFPIAPAMGRFAQGRIQVATGHPEEGIAEMELGITDFRITGQRTGVPGMLALLSEAYHECGDGKRAINAALSGRELLAETGETRHSAILHRAEGEAHALLGAPSLAMHSLKAAIEIAEAEGERFSELRARASLASLLDAQGERDAARSTLEKILPSIEEGGELSAVRDARAHLRALAL